MAGGRWQEAGGRRQEAGGEDLVKTHLSKDAHRTVGASGTSSGGITKNRDMRGHFLHS